MLFLLAMEKKPKAKARREKRVKRMRKGMSLKGLFGAFLYEIWRNWVWSDESGYGSGEDDKRGWVWVDDDDDGLWSYKLEGSESVVVVVAIRGEGWTLLRVR